jgi:hypothetical protein
MELAMQTSVLVIFTLMGVAAVAALSLGLYKALPASLLEGAGLHGRFAGLGMSERQPHNTASAARSIESNSLPGQSV